MYKHSLAVAVSLASIPAGAHAADSISPPQGFIEGSKATLSARNMYYGNDNRDRGTDQKEWAQGFVLNYLSGFTQGTMGFGLDAQAILGVHLDGGRGNHPDNNTFAPSDSDGSAESTWARAGANAKVRLSKTELRVGNALAPNVPVLVANDGRLLPQTFQGGVITSKDLDSVTFTGGKFNQAAGRASANYSGLAVAGGAQDSNSFVFGGADWKITKDLTLQYYYANLQDYYKQNFLGAIHVLPLGEDQSFKTDLRYFDSRSEGKNGEVGYRFNNNGGYAKDLGEVNNKTWSAMFTYALGGHSLMVGHQRVGDDGGMAWVSNGNIVDSRNRNEGQGGSSFYLFTDSLINQFARAGENTTFGQYSYDFAKVGVPGLKLGAAYLHGEDIKGVAGGSDHTEWERDLRLDYVIQTGPLQGLGTTVRHGVYRGDDSGSVRDTDQLRVILNYTWTVL